MPQFDESSLAASEIHLRSFCPQKVKKVLPSVPGAILITWYSLLSKDYDVDPAGGPAAPPPSKTPAGKGNRSGGKLARRARSFKEDFLDKLSNIRSNPRSQSPHSPKMSKQTNGTTDLENEQPANPLRELDQLVKQVHLALKHLRDVVSKNKLEMLPGNGTIVLEIVTNIVSNLRNYFIGEQSSALMSATSHLHQCLARLIRLCDDVVLYGSQALGRENINQLVQSVQEAVQSLIDLAHSKVAIKSNNNAAYKNGKLHMEANGRASLPDIPLTPRERQILAQTPHRQPNSSSKILGHSMSSESILEGHEAPPPKPPLPHRNNGESPTHLTSGRSRSTAPPLPPKRRNRSANAAHSAASTHSLSPPCTPAPPSGSLELVSSAERLSISPAHSAGRSSGGNGEDSSSLLSASNAGSMDSVNNHLQILDDYDDDSLYIRSNGNISPNFWGNSSSRRASVDSPSFFNSNDLREPPPISLTATTNGHVSRVLLNYNDDVPDFKNSVTSSSSSYVSQQSCSSTSISYSSDTTSFASHSVSTSKRTVVTSELSSSSTSDYVSFGAGSPPALPQKTRMRAPRLPSQYDNVGSTMTNLNQMLMSNSNVSPSDGMPPPLPPKMRHIHRNVHSYMSVLLPNFDESDPESSEENFFKAYMEMFGKYSSPSTAWSESISLRHSMHTYSALQAEWARNQAEMSMSSTHSCLFSSSSSYSVTHWAPLERSDNQPNLADTSPGGSPPALPPKLRNNRHSISPPPQNNSFTLSSLTVPAPPSPVTPVTPTPIMSPPPPPVVQNSNTKEPPIYDFGRELPPPPPRPTSIAPLPAPTTAVQTASPDLTPLADSGRVNSMISDAVTTEVDEEEGPLDEVDVSQWLVFKKPEEEGPDIRGGHLDALIVHATKANKNDEDKTDFLYQEAFLTTYRTFMSPLELIMKLQRRYRRFAQPVNDSARQRAARNSFSLLVRVVSDLTIKDLETDLLKILNDLIFTLVESGDLNIARALRGKVLEKCDAKRFCNTTPNPYHSTISMQSRQCTLLDFKSDQLAEQMTLLDAELFMKIEIPEVLLWAQEQSEERSPNLTEFTEHFNKMSYWARSRILEQKDAKDRERYVVKFIKVMRHLRKVNNFNSYLALLSALDSAPIRRLEWHRQITEGLKEYCALIDSSSSFRAYRQALADTHPPCIPYIGLVLQDLTFVNIGNSNSLPDGSINFSKRWQQFNIVENMKKFKKCQYHFKKQERILALFNNFDDFLCEEAMWQISETIKPRGQSSAKK
ncbi:guanine nucleotide-releasing factor 2 isoform X2 [Neocloeon triangulifer]|uniref:guanine nucleotide-releasing factor 2 isoform X2 n=1 Tax=Neocloeon triangulifer TaxID=2078957 RepID=UPI00286F8243|nr:guanine nucleotide-releasing factor 2 isoform X2 [Neocloeon triangulifer]